MKVNTRNQTEQSMKTVVLGNGFLKKYAPALREVSSTFKKEKPDLIIGLSRKAPRLLELLRLTGIWPQNIPVISEKALDFIPPEELNGKKILVFDDIVISGTTVTDVLSYLALKYDARLKFVCLAIDEDTIALERDAKGNYWIKLANKEKVLLDYKVPLSKDDRFIFCNEIVRLFAILNKPYDIDYPIFYTLVDHSVMSSLVAQSEPDKAYNLTTVQQFNNGFCRYTFLPTDQSKVDGLCNNIFPKYRLNPQVCKVRSYSNLKTWETAFVPLLTFGVNSKSFKEEQIFVDRFSCYNDLTRQVRGLVDSENEAKAIYRIVWYIVCYLYGLSFIQRNLKSKNRLNSYKPSQMLRDEDLFYIFGPSLTRTILDFLDAYYEQTIKEIEEDMSVNFSDSNSQGSFTDVETASLFDVERTKLYEDILPYITANMKTDWPLTDQIATVFEGLYYLVEVPTQEAIREAGIKGYEHRRLGVGFNLAQIKEILNIQGVIPDNSHDIDMKISLALDFLVDAGIAIPIFYYERGDGYFERAYRYGEDAPSAKQYGYLIASTLKRLFDYTTNQHKTSVLPRIVLEKMGVSFQEEMLRTGVADILKELVDARDRRLIISPYYSKFGKVLNISDEAYEESIWHPFFFTTWCTREGITRDTDGGLTYSGEFLKKLEFPNGYSPKLVSTDKLVIFESLAILLYHINNIVDKGGRYDYLIALTTCGDHESYLGALREELRLFFKSHSHKFNLPLTKTNEYLEDSRKQSLIVVEEILSLLLERSYSAAHEIRHKKHLWVNTHGIVSEIEEYFNNSDIWLRIAYQQNLKFHIDKMQIAHDLPVDISLGQFREEIEIFGELCIHLSSILRNLLELTKQNHKLRITKSGQFHKGDLQVIDNRFSDLNDSLNKWDHFRSKYVEMTSGNLPKISLKTNMDSDLSNFRWGVSECIPLMAQVVPQVNDAYKTLEEIFNERYSLPVWEAKMTQLFPKGEDLLLTGIKKAIEVAAKCTPEDDRIHPKVGAVVIKDDEIVCTAYRGELSAGDHAEYTVLVKKCKDKDFTGATLITTLEPCTNRRHDKKPCALHVIEKGIKKVIIGMLDPNREIRGKGVLYLQARNVQVEFFPSDYQDEVRRLNQEFWNEGLKKYRNDLMNDLRTEPETNAASIEAEVYASTVQNSSEVVREMTFEVTRKRLSEEEIKNVCFYLNIDYDDLEGKGKTGKIRELVIKFYRENRMKVLLDAIGKCKPEVVKEIIDPTLGSS